MYTSGTTSRARPDYIVELRVDVNRLDSNFEGVGARVLRTYGCAFMMKMCTM